METIASLLPYIQVSLSILLIIAILMQRSSAGLSGAFGGSDSAVTFNTRRGIEKTLFNATIGLAVMFVLTTFIPLIIS